MAKPFESPQIIPVGDYGLSLVFGESISLETHQKIHQVCKQLEKQTPEGVLEWVPTYGALLIVYDPLICNYETVKNAIRIQIEQLENSLNITNTATKDDVDVITLPVCYGGEYGPDLAQVIRHTGLSEVEVIQRHTAPLYLVHMLGFTPGFPYLGGMDETLETPRLKTPRTRIPAGAVGIAGKQTGVYPSASPGGWQLIGQTPLSLFDPKRAEPFLLRAGQRLKFKAIDEEAFEALRVGQSKEVVQMALTETREEAVFRVVNAGALTTMQDLGRLGYRQYGVSVGGAMDITSSQGANLLLGNAVQAAVLEMTYMGVSLEVLQDCQVAYTGAVGMFTINQQVKAMDCAHTLRKGDQLQIGAFETGVRGYLAVSGGFLGQQVMGSMSTDLRSQFGGYEGRALKAGDLLNAAQVVENTTGHTWKAKDNGCSSDVPIRVIKGPQVRMFTEADLQTFTNSIYTVTKESDRMGMRLEGQSLSPIGGGDILSDGILAGAIQVPGHGKPIVMLADCQTTGGYAKIAQVISVDLPRFAQMKPNETLKFEWVELEEAQALYREAQNRGAQNGEPLNKERKNSGLQTKKCWRLQIDGKSFDVEVEEVL